MRRKTLVENTTTRAVVDRAGAAEGCRTERPRGSGEQPCHSPMAPNASVSDEEATSATSTHRSPPLVPPFPKKMIKFCSLEHITFLSFANPCKAVHRARYQSDSACSAPDPANTWSTAGACPAHTSTPVKTRGRAQAQCRRRRTRTAGVCGVQFAAILSR